MVTLAGAQGYYGDSPEGIRSVLEAEPDFVVCEALAELTLAILQKDRMQDAALGYTKDLPVYLREVLPEVAAGRVRFITNAGGINPDAAARIVAREAVDAGAGDLLVGVVTGSDLTPRLEELRRKADGFPHMRTGEVAPSSPVAFATAYLGAKPIVDALDKGAQIVITGRVADAALFLAPLVHTYRWAFDDWDRLAAGTVVGHLLECSTQVTGGNLSGPWRLVPRPQDLAFPVAHVEEDGRALVTKGGGGGAVDFETVRQQLLYEVEDPRRYLAPDCVADFTSLHIERAGSGGVIVSGAKGAPATDSYKAILAWVAGFLGEARVGFAWPDAVAKATSVKNVVEARVSGLAPDIEFYWELMGAAKGGGRGGVFGPPDSDELAAMLAEPLESQPSEVVLRVAVRTGRREVAALLQREFNKMGLSGPPGMFGVGRGGGGVSTLLRVWPTLVPKDAVDPWVRVEVAEARVLLGESGTSWTESDATASRSEPTKVPKDSGSPAELPEKAAGHMDLEGSFAERPTWSRHLEVSSMCQGRKDSDNTGHVATFEQLLVGRKGDNTGSQHEVEIYLAEFCTARSGDKDDTVNVALFAPDPEAYELLRAAVTAERVAAHLGSLVRGVVERFEAPNVLALNFVCNQALDGGASASRRSDNLGKAFGSHLLGMRVRVPADMAARLRGRIDAERGSVWEVGDTRGRAPRAI